MTPTSATKRGDDLAQAAELLAVISRRASHEVRNALNAVSVNVEVVRSRMLKPDPNLVELRSFAERACKESDVAASLATGLADLTRLFARAAAGTGEAALSHGTGRGRSVIIPMSSDDDNNISADLSALAARMGIAIKLDGKTVIFTVRD